MWDSEIMDQDQIIGQHIEESKDLNQKLMTVKNLQFMSQASIQVNDTGYTSPDFIKNLFKPLTTPTNSETDCGSLKSVQSLSQYASFEEKNLKSKIIPRLSPSKLMRSNSVFDEDRATVKKLKIFYQTQMHNLKKDSEIQQVWKRFEESLENPFLFDKFIEQIRLNSQNSHEFKNNNQLNLNQLQLQRQIRFAHSIPKCKPKQLYNVEQPLKTKKKAEPWKRRKEIKQCVGYIHKIMVHGEKFIRDK